MTGGLGAKARHGSYGFVPLSHLGIIGHKIHVFTLKMVFYFLYDNPQITNLKHKLLSYVQGLHWI